MQGQMVKSARRLADSPCAGDQAVVQVPALLLSG